MPDLDNSILLSAVWCELQDENVKRDVLVNIFSVRNTTRFKCASSPDPFTAKGKSLEIVQALHGLFFVVVVHLMDI